MGYGSPIGYGTEYTDTPNRDWLLERGGGFRKTAVIEANSQDAGNTGERVTKLRSGLVLGKISATGSDQNKYLPCSEAASDGSQTAAGILYSKVDMLDEGGVAGDRVGTIIAGPAYVDATKCFCTNSGGSQVALSTLSTSLTALRGDGMVFKGDF